MKEANFITKNSMHEWPALGQIHQHYFVKFQPCQHLNLKSRIEETEKLIEKRDQEEDQIIEKLKKKWLDRGKVFSEFQSLRYKEDYLESNILWRKMELYPLQVALDKLCCANKACQARTIHSGGELNTHSFNQKMLHKTKSMAEEKQLLREIKASQRKAVDPCLSMKELNSRIMRLHSRMIWEKCSSAEKKQLLREIKELEVERDNMISNATLKGKILDSLGSKESVQCKIKDISDDLGGRKEEHRSVKAKIKQVKKEMKAIDKCTSFLHKKLAVIYLEKDAIYKHLLQLRKQQDEGS